jgi:hypothetical protein
MPSRLSRKLVIDACVARAAGGEQATFPASKNCRDFLHAVRELSHHIVKTQEIWAEWRKHKSKYASVWLSSMIARKRVFEAAVVSDTVLRSYVSSSACEREAETMRKDCHLVEAAKASDNIVISNDEEVRDLFFEASNAVRWLQTIAWVNPTIPSETPIDWLTNGAAPEAGRCLRRSSARSYNNI